jgi:hypothetical protein
MKQPSPQQAAQQPVDPSAMQQMLLAAQHVPLILADGAQLSGASWSLIINLMQTRAIGSQVATMPAASVSMSWPLAKALHRMLGDVIARFEQTEGPISVPKSFEATLSVVSEQTPQGLLERPKPNKKSRPRRS